MASIARLLVNKTQKSIKLNGNVLDLGSRNCDLDFYKKKYQIIDVSLIHKVDLYQGDLTTIKMDLNVVGYFDINYETVLAFNLLEHLHSPDNFFKNISTCLANTGSAYVMTPFMYPYHADPKDYFRPSIDLISFLANKNSLVVKSFTPIGVGPFHVFFNYISLIINYTPFSWVLLIMSTLFDGILGLVGLKSKNFFIYTLVELKKINYENH
jgi:hypothetical protein